MNEPLVLVSLLPGIILHLIWLLSILIILASVFLKKFPPINQYYFPIRVGGFALLLFMTYIEGAHFINNKWQEKAAELQEKIKLAEEQARQTNTVIEEKIVEKTKVIKEKGDVVVQYVDRVVKGDTQVIEKNLSEAEREKFRAQITELSVAQKNCPVVPELVINMHNEAAKPPFKGDKK